MAELDALIDSTITLITEQNLRYDGTLFSINAAESSIVLKDVKCFGTEDRVTDPKKKVQPSDNVIAFVTFPGNEIMDLFVHEEEETAKTPQIAPTLPSEPKQNKSKADNNRRQDENKPVSAPRAPAEKSNSKPAPKKENNAKTVVGSGEHLLKLKERKAGDAPVATEGEFDFQAGLTVFKKTEILAQVAEAGVEAVKETKYVKDDFFDMISNDQLDREEGRRTKMTGSQERSVNQDTFGATALQGGNNYRRYNNNYGGRGRGRGGGGGRGRGRGRGRSSAPTN